MPQRSSSTSGNHVAKEKDVKRKKVNGGEGMSSPPPSPSSEEKATAKASPKQGPLVAVLTGAMSYTLSNGQKFLKDRPVKVDDEALVAELIGSGVFTISR